MHFVKKVPTTSEERLQKEKERAVKLKTFCQLRDRIFSKRAARELDEEILNLCEAILARNPDIYTLWNIRRETLEKMRERKMAGEEGVPDLERLYHNELGLTEQCIKANPKSYSAWFQRGWILGHQETPDLKRELAMCEQALTMDCRNFHCWDHRRIVASMAKLTDEEELAFSQKLLAYNFSNFSAWHMRMSLIPRFEDPESGEKLMRPQDVNEEIKRAANAIFTDPNDQSAWICIRWIIDLYSPSSFMNEESSCPIVPLSASITEGRLIVVFTRAVTAESALSFFHISPNSAWRAVSLYSTKISRVWECTLEGKEPVEISRDGTTFETLTTFIRRDLYEKMMAGRSVDVINKIREHCEELLQVEENNSMAIETVTECLRLTSPIQSHSTIMDNLEKLASTLDPLRANMYRSFASHERLRFALMNKREGGEKTRLEEVLSGEGRLSLTYLQLSELSHIDLLAPFVTEIDLRGNGLRSVSEMALLPLLTSLAMDENPVESLPPSLSSLSQLDFISCASTRLSGANKIGPILQKCHSLKRFLYCDTALVDETDALRAKLGDSIRLFPHYL